MSTEQHGDLEKVEHIRSSLLGIEFPVAALGAAISDDLRKQTEGFGTALALMSRSPVVDIIAQQFAASALQQVITAAAPLTQYVSQQIVDMYKLVVPLQEIMRPWMDAQRTMVEPLLQQMEQDRTHAETIGPYFEEAGLWFSGAWPLSMWVALRRVHAKGELTASALTAYVVDTYHRDHYRFLESTVQRWWDEPAFARWQRHLGDALAAHKEGKFTLSVPTLILVCEDVMREVSGMSSTNMSKLSTAIQEMLSDWSLSAISDRPLAVALERLTKPGGLQDPIPSFEPERWHRHRILHGGDPDYGTALNSLRLFILLDEFQRVIQKRVLSGWPKQLAS